MGILSTGLSGLLNSRDGLSVSSNNVANANNPAYRRQQVQQVSQQSQFVNGGHVGQGVETVDVTRITDEFLENQILRTNSRTNYSDTLATQLERIDDLFADGNNALSESITAFSNAAQDLSLRPTDLPTRQNFLDKADFVAQQFNSLGRRLDDIQRDNNSKIEQSVADINGITQNLATINEQISRDITEQDGRGLPLDLLDQRDDLIKQLSGKIAIQTVKDDQGRLNIFMKNGQPLVTNERSFDLLAITDPSDPENLVIARESVAGDTPVRFSTRYLGEGQLSALLEYRNGPLSRYQGTLGLMAARFAEQANEVQFGGLDLNGNTGQALFEFANSTAVAPPATGIDSIAETVSAFDNADPANVRMQVETLNTSQLRVPEYEIFAVDDGNNGIEYKFRELGSGNVAIPLAANGNTFTASTPSGLELFSISFAGTPELGDSFTLRTSVNGSSQLRFTGLTAEDVVARADGAPSGDNSQAVLFAKVADNASLYKREDGSGGVSIRDAFSRMLTVIGNDTITARTEALASGSVLQRLEAEQSAVSGVNLDEEAAQLIKYQQAYNANAKVISMSQQLFEELLSAIR